MKLSSDKKLLSVVVPCYNEEESLPLFHQAVTQAFAGCGYSYEIIYVDDGSRDRTMLQLRKLHKAQDCPVKVIRFSRNFGKEAALYAGIKHAEGDYISLIDADLQQHPDVVVEMLAEIDNILPNISQECNRQKHPPTAQEPLQR